MTNNYYQKHKGRLRKETHKTHQNLSEDKRQKKVRERYQNTSDKQSRSYLNR